MKISVLGTGAYGIALAKMLYCNGNKVSMWTKFKEELEVINIKRENEKVLPKVKIDKDIYITTDMNECIKDSKIVIIAVPISAVRDVSKELSMYIKKGQTIAISSKGIDPTSGMLMTDIVYEETKCEDISVISGPSFAIDIINKNRMALVSASNNKKSRILTKLTIENDNIVVQESDDQIGVQVCGAIKNVYAIAMGMVHELKISESTKATLLTVFLNDIQKIVKILGGKEETVYTYAGVGDFLLTAMSKTSRNYSFGRSIAIENKSVDETLRNIGTKTVEGLYTLEAVKKMLDKKRIRIDSINKLYEIIYKKKSANKILECIK